MKEILICTLILGSAVAYGGEEEEFFLGRKDKGRIVLELDEAGNYGREFQYLVDEAGQSNSQNKFEFNGFTSGFSYGYEWENRVSFELGVKVYVTEDDLEDEGYLEEEAWQHSLYASIGYRF